MRIKSYNEYMKEGIEDIFRSAHGAIQKKDLQPLKKFIGKSKFPTQEEVDKAVEFLGIDPDYLFYDKNDFLHPILYWKGPIYYGFFGGLNMEALKMMRVDQYFKHKMEDVEKAISSKDYERLFHRVDKKILIPTFIDMYDEIPDNQKYDVFTDLYTRSEYGFQMFPIEIIKDCFSKRKLSKDWKTRMKDFSQEVKPADDGKITLYRGQNLGSAGGDDAFSWTTSKKTAKFFAERFSKGAGKIITKKIDPSEAIDYLQDRGESEVILFPKKFGSMNESLNEATADDTIVNITSPTMYPVRIILAAPRNKVRGHVTVRFAHPNMGSTIWFELDENGKIDILTRTSELEIVAKLQEIFNNWTSFYSKGAIESKGSETMKVLEDSSIFGKWWKEVSYKYRGHITGKHYGI